MSSTHLLAYAGPLQRTNANTPSVATIAIAPVETVVAGDPRWSTLDAEIEGTLTGTLDTRQPLRWGDPDHLLFTSTAALYSIELDEAT